MHCSCTSTDHYTKQYQDELCGMVWSHLGYETGLLNVDSMGIIPGL